MNLYFPEELQRRPLRLTDDQRRFLVEYVESGGEFKGSILAVWGKYTTNSRDWAARTLRMPDAQWYMHRYRLHEDRRIFRSPLDLCVVLEQIATSTRTAMKYRIRALEMITKLMVAHQKSISAPTTHTEPPITPDQLQEWRRRVITVDVEAREKETRENDVIAAITPELPDVPDKPKSG